MTMLDDIKRNMLASDQTIEGFNPRQTALYLGLQCEELAEKLTAVFGTFDTLPIELDNLASDLKRGLYDTEVEEAERQDTLDADIDLLVVTFGAALSQGADLERAWSKVDQANSSKINPETGKMTKDANGKWIKPQGWKAPDLSDCVCKD